MDTKYGVFQPQKPRKRFQKLKFESTFTVRIIDHRHYERRITFPRGMNRPHLIREHVVRAGLIYPYSHKQRSGHKKWKLYTKSGKPIVHFDRSSFFRRCIESKFVLVTARDLLFRTRPLMNTSVAAAKTMELESLQPEDSDDNKTVVLQPPHKKRCLEQVRCYVPSRCRIHIVGAHKSARPKRRRSQYVYEYVLRPECLTPPGPIRPTRLREPWENTSWIIIVVIYVAYGEMYGGFGRGGCSSRRPNHGLYQPRSKSY